MSWPTQMSPTGQRSPQSLLLAGGILLLAPAAILAIDSGQHTGMPRSIAIGVAVTIAIEGLFLISRYGAARAAGSLFTIAFYAVVVLVLRFNAPDLGSAWTNAALAVCILIPVALFTRREVATTGGNARQVKFLISQLLARKEWPDSFANYRACPIIQSLHSAIGDNAGPVLPLLAHEDVRVQMAALTALEFHPTWRSGQAEAVLQRATYTETPAVRAAALLALGNVVKTRHVHSMLPYMYDASQEVRQAAAVAILWDAPNRWPEIRSQVRAALAAPHAAKDGPLPCSGSLPPIALDDLVNWAVESGAIGKRATATLVRHCKKAIHEDGSPEAIARVTDLVVDSKVPAAIRVEFAHRLQSADVFSPDIATRMLGPANPTMLRVLAAGAVLHDHNDPSAVEALREAAKQPNREIILAAAGIIQKYLGVDLGLAVGGDLPATNSREAAEIARRVKKWASDPGSEVGADTPADAEIPIADAAYF
jgi:HEAT repeat protein